MGAGIAQVQPVDRGVRAAETGYRPEHQLLMDGGGTSADRAAVEAGVVCGEIFGALDRAGQDQGAEAGACCSMMASTALACASASS
jgi:hypothetical protein